MAIESTAPSIRKHERAKHRGVYEKIPGSGIWWILYYDSDGKRHREKVGRRSAAITLYQKRKTEIREGVKLPANLRQSGEKLSALLDRAIKWYESHRPKALKHATTHVKAIKAGLGDKVAADLTPDDVDDWLGSHMNWSPATINRHKATLSKALQLAVISGKLKRNVARLVTARKENNGRVRKLEEDEERRVVEAIQKKYPHQLPAFMIAIHTGMRKSEQFSLQWDEVDMKRKRIFLDKTKNGTTREVPMNKTCYQAFCDLWKERKQRLKKGKTVNQWVFQSSRTEGKKRLMNPRSWFEDVLIDAKVENFHWHDLRHSFCSRLVMAGVDLRTVMELAGHKTITMAARYSHLAPGHNLAAIEKLDAHQSQKQKTSPQRRA